MVIHPDLYWLKDIEGNIQDANWRQENLDPIIKSLGYYLSHADYVIVASSILDLCYDEMLGHGRYTELFALYILLIETFDSNNPIPPHPENTNASNIERFPNEYFTSKLKLAHVALLLHDIEEATHQVEHLRELYDGATLVEQLEACCLFLNYHSYGHNIDFGFNLILRTQQLANKFPNELRLKGELAIARYYYSKGNIPDMEKVLRKTIRLISKTNLETSKISAITAELNFYLAVLYRELYEHDKAFAKLDVASEQYARLDNHVQNMLVQYETAMIYYLQEENKKALQWIDLAIQEFNKLGEKQDYHQAMLDHGKGTILFNLKQYDKTLTLIQRVLLFWKKQKHDYHIALAKNALGATVMHLARPVEALEHLEEAKAICDPIKDRGYVQELIKIIDNNIADAKSQLS
jgi:tetratricopeptide (TPR) repeat protein